MEYMKNYWSAIVKASKCPDAPYELNKLLNPYSSHIRYDNSNVINEYLSYVAEQKKLLPESSQSNIDKHVKNINAAVSSMCCKKQIYKLHITNDNSVNKNVVQILDIENNIFPKTVIRATFVLATLCGALGGRVGKWYLPLYVLPVINGVISRREFSEECYKCNQSITDIMQNASGIRVNLVYGRK
jgi:hypothetical protein